MTNSNPSELLAERLKARRKERGLSFDEMARLSGVSRSMLSQVERGQSSPTVSTLWNITKALGVDLPEVLDEAVPSGVIAVIQNEDIPVIEKRGKGYRVRILSSPDYVEHLEVYDISMGADGELDSEAHWKGCREHVSVIEGSIRIRCGQERAVLSVGDTAIYAADVAHRIAAHEGLARIQLIVSAI